MENRLAGIFIFTAIVVLAFGFFLVPTTKAMVNIPEVPSVRGFLPSSVISDTSDTIDNIREILNSRLPRTDNGDDNNPPVVPPEDNSTDNGSNDSHNDSNGSIVITEVRHSSGGSSGSRATVRITNRISNNGMVLGASTVDWNSLTAEERVQILAPIVRQLQELVRMFVEYKAHL